MDANHWDLELLPIYLNEFDRMIKSYNTAVFTPALYQALGHHQSSASPQADIDTQA